MRVFHGISGAAGQPASIVAALRKQGIDAKNYVIGENKFSFDFDRRLVPEGDANTYFFNLLATELMDFDVFHFYFRTLFFDHLSANHPTGIDLILLRLAGKKIIMNFRGSEVRLHSEFRRRSEFHYVDENPDNLIAKFPEDIQLKHIDLCNAVCNHVLVPDPELQGYVPGSIVVPRSVDLDKWRPRPNTGHRVPRIVHAPSRRAVKGSDHIDRAIENLRAEGLEFEFSLVEGVSNDEAKQIYEHSDIIIDQLRIGWYGVLAVEGMALQKCVVSFVRQDLISHFAGEPPVAVANPNTITDVLRELITNPSLREATARRGRGYCERIHDSKIIAQRLADLYKTDGNEVNPEVLALYQRDQYQMITANHTELSTQVKSLERELKLTSRNLEKKADHLAHLQHKLRFFYWLRRFFRGQSVE